MSEATTTDQAGAGDPLQSAADAMALAVRAVKDGAADAGARASELAPNVGLFLSRLTYTTTYALSYGAVFPTLLVARSLPRENAFVHGLIDGAAAARDAVMARADGAAAGGAHEAQGAEPEGEPAPQPA